MNPSLPANGVAPPDAGPLRERPYPLPPLPPDRYYVESVDPTKVGDGALMFVEDSDDFDTFTYRSQENRLSW